MMADYENGRVNDSDDRKVLWEDADFPWIFLIFFLCLFGGDDVKSAVKETGISKLKEARPDGEQLIRNYEEITRLTSEPI